FLGRGRIDFAHTSNGLTINGQPYTLESDLASLAADIASDTSGNFALANDYDAGNEAYDDAPIPSLFGTVEGLGHRISNLNISERVVRNGEVGLLGDLGGVVRDLFVQNIELHINKGNFGGAIAGINAGSILHAKASGDVSGGHQFAGGLVGWNRQQGQILKSSANVHVSGATDGGLVGWNIGSIEQSFACGNVAGGGGLVAVQSDGGIISNSYASGHIISGFGGLIGSGNVTVTSSYSRGAVDTVTNAGGFAGVVNSNAVQNAYWDIDTSGQSQGCGSGDCTGIKGLSDAQLKSGLPKGFDPKIWGSDPTINNGYPYLRNNPPQ
ncbi:MAG: hypothetical protein JO208_07715, partial [Alphaproteobacteria bacterium]|nr:hypothetical protein [Alphaproteobacteria bacterium]